MFSSKRQYPRYRAKLWPGTAPLNKSVGLARQNATLSRPCNNLLLSYLSAIRPRTILGIINRNRGVNNKLTPNRRGKIKGTVAIGASFTRAATLVDYDPEIARKTILLTPERYNKISKSRSGRP